jgi:hypothetical protein
MRDVSGMTDPVVAGLVARKKPISGPDTRITAPPANKPKFDRIISNGLKIKRERTAT